MSTISTFVKHDETKLQTYKSTYSPEEHGFTLKLLEYISLGYTDGVSHQQTVTENGNTIVIGQRNWSNEDIAREWCGLVTKYHPSGFSANVVID